MGNPTFNAALEWIDHIIENIVRNYNIKDTCVNEDEPCLGILAATGITIFPTAIGLKGYIWVQLVFRRYMILPIKHILDWE